MPRLLLPFLTFCLLWSGGIAVAADGGVADAPAEESATIADAPTEEKGPFPDPLELLRAADDLFSRQGIGALSARVVGYRDPADEITLRQLRSGEVEDQGLVPLMGRYEYWAPNHYNFFLLGFLMASSEVQTGRAGTMTSPLLPLPGGILTTATVLDRFNVRVSGIQPYGEEGGGGPGEGTEDCYVLRLQPKNYKGEFFKSLTYYISVAEPHLVRGVRATFSDGGQWTGTGYGSFYYKDYDGRRLPFIGEGVISFRNPSRQMIIKGKWRDYQIGEAAAVSPDAVEKSDPTTPMG
ncbi:MAG TPA: hypothetical protein VEI97_02160 [bacterium]|nr:hypothetical protein [bacterium]